MFLLACSVSLYGVSISIGSIKTKRGQESGGGVQHVNSKGRVTASLWLNTYIGEPSYLRSGF